MNLSQCEVIGKLLFYLYLKGIIWLTIHQHQCTRATTNKYNYAPMLSTDETPDWGCPSHSKICDLICKYNGHAFGYCNGANSHGGCTCFASEVLKNGILTQQFLKNSGLVQVIFPRVTCTKNISGCDVVCIKTMGQLSLCGGQSPLTCNCYFTNGTALENVLKPKPPGSSSTTMTSISADLLHSRCPKTRSPCDFYCSVLGSPFGYCLLNRRKCHCVRSQLRGTYGGVAFYRDARMTVKAYGRSFGCPRIAQCATECLLEGGQFSVCGLHPPYGCFCYFPRNSSSLPENIRRGRQGLTK